MKNDIKRLLTKAKPLTAKVVKYGGFIVVIAFLLLYAFLVLDIGKLARVEPSDTAINEQLSKIKRPKIDDKALQQVQDLEDQNVDVKTLFDNARNNPFSEN